MTDATQATPVARRYRDAVSAQGGACNALALANSLVAAIREARAENIREKDCPACRLIAHQLSFLLDIGQFDNGEPMVYTRSMEFCEARA